MIFAAMYAAIDLMSESATQVESELRINCLGSCKKKKKKKKD